MMTLVKCHEWVLKRKETSTIPKGGLNDLIGGK